MVKPLLKWAGGKRQLLKDLVSRAPQEFNNFWEPFLGGAALFFNLSENSMAHAYFLSDINPDLCLFYHVVRDNPEDLIGFISSLDYRNAAKDYYDARSRFNNIDGRSHPVEKSGLMLYLNRHCFNGLYRVNSKGIFNVPFGSYISPRMPSNDQINAASRLLKKSTIVQGDFQSALSGAKEGDFVYMDPPYEPLSRSSSFTAYSTAGFNREQQVRLSSVIRSLDRKGVKFMLSNSGSSNLSELYSGFNTVTIAARRNINSIGTARGLVKEILVTNY